MKGGPPKIRNGTNRAEMLNRIRAPPIGFAVPMPPWPSCNSVLGLPARDVCGGHTQKVPLREEARVARLQSESATEKC